MILCTRSTSRSNEQSTKCRSRRETWERLLHSIVKITRLCYYQTWQTPFFEKFRRYVGFFFFLTMLFRCWLTEQANSDHMNDNDLLKCWYFLSFKIRGAMNAVLRLVESLSSKEKVTVVTHSSGNHAQALSLAAKLTGLQAYIAMPHNAADVKKAAVKGYGAHIRECGISYKVWIKTSKSWQDSRTQGHTTPHCTTPHHTPLHSTHHTTCNTTPHATPLHSTHCTAPHTPFHTTVYYTTPEDLVLEHFYGKRNSDLKKYCYKPAP